MVIAKINKIIIKIITNEMLPFFIIYLDGYENWRGFWEEEGVLVTNHCAAFQIKAALKKENIFFNTTVDLIKKN